MTNLTHDRIEGIARRLAGIARAASISTASCDVVDQASRTLMQLLDEKTTLSAALVAVTAERDAAVAALTQSRAETAAVIERAAMAVADYSAPMQDSAHDAVGLPRVGAQMAKTIRALSTPDQTAALDVAKDTAWAKGMENAAAIADEFGADGGNIIRSYIPKGGAE